MSLSILGSHPQPYDDDGLSWPSTLRLPFETCANGTFVLAPGAPILRTRKPHNTYRAYNRYTLCMLLSLVEAKKATAKVGVVKLKNRKYLDLKRLHLTLHNSLSMLLTDTYNIQIFERIGSICMYVLCTFDTKVVKYL